MAAKFVIRSDKEIYQSPKCPLMVQKQTFANATEVALLDPNADIDLFLFQLCSCRDPMPTCHGDHSAPPAHRQRADEVLTRIPDVLEPWGFDCRSIDFLRERLNSHRVPADDIVAIFENEKSVEGM